MSYKLFVAVIAMILVFASEAAAVSWSAPVNLSAAGEDAYYPQVTGSADGSKLTSVWQRLNGFNYIIQASTSSDSGATWSAPVDLSVAGEDSLYPQLTGSADGSKVTSVWRRYNGGNSIIQASTSSDSGATWSAPVDLSAAGRDAAYGSQVTNSADGSKLTSVWGVWQGFNGSNSIIQASTSSDSGATWSTPVDLSAAGPVEESPQVTGSADGSKLTSVWRRDNGSNSIIQASTSSDSGATWSAPVDLSVAGRDAGFGFQVTGSADGSKLTCVWGLWRGFNGSNPIIQASTSSDSGAHWSAPVNLSVAGQDAYESQVTGSADGSKLTSVWTRDNGSNYIIQASTSSDSGAIWSAPVNLSVAGQDAVGPQVTGSADGSKLTSVWQRYIGSNSIIQASTSSDSGATWSAPVNLSVAGQDAVGPQVTGSADGSKLTSVWQRYIGSNSIIQASTSSDSGATWSAPVNLSVAGQDAVGPQVTGSADGSKLTSVWERFNGSNWIIQSATTLWTRSGSGMFYVIPNKKGGAAVIYLE